MGVCCLWHIKRNAVPSHNLIWQTKARRCSENYHVTSQTAYHIAELALQEKTTEGRIIDKLMRNYLAERGVYHMEHCNKGYE